MTENNSLLSNSSPVTLETSVDSEEAEELASAEETELEEPTTDLAEACTSVEKESNVEHESALFLMRVTDQLSLSHTGIDKICSATQWLLDSVGDSIADKVKECLRQSGITNQDILANVDGVCHPPDVFANLSSRYYRDKYFEKNFNYVVKILLLLSLIIIINTDTRTYLPRQ